MHMINSAYIVNESNRRLAVLKDRVDELLGRKEQDVWMQGFIAGKVHSTRQEIEHLLWFKQGVED